MADSDTKMIKAKKKYVLVREEPKKILKRKVKIVRDEDIIKAIPITLGDEVQQALEEWYSARGESLPEEYVGFGAKVDEEERTRFKAEMDAAYPSDPSLAPKQIGPKPEFGTPEFWKWARERRAEKNAERAAKGLPPLPTKGKGKKVDDKKDAVKPVTEVPTETKKIKKVKKVEDKIEKVTEEVTKVKKIKVKKIPLEATNV